MLRLFDPSHYPFPQVSEKDLEMLVREFVPDDSAITTPTVTVQAPQKVFIERNDGVDFEYSEDAPAIVNQLYDILNGYYSASNYIELFYSLPEVFAPIHEIASRVADATWQLKKAFNDTVDYRNDAFNRLFSNPNPFFSFQEFVYISVCYEILTGKQLWYLNKPIDLTGTPDDILSWSNLESHRVKIEMRKDFDPYLSTEVGDAVDYYYIPKSNGGRRRFDSKDVMTCLNLSLQSGYDLNKCVPLIKGADKAIKNLIPVYMARGVIYTKRGAQGFLVSRARDAGGPIGLSPNERKEIEDEHFKSYGLSNNKRPYGISGANLEFVRTIMSIAELQPFDETLADAVAIYSVLRVPKHLVPRKDNSTFNNADSDMKAFYTNVIIPWANKYAKLWTVRMGWDKLRRYIVADYSHIDVLQENKKEKADVDKTNTDTYLTRYKEGFITKNAVLAAWNLDGIGPDGDVYAGQGDNPDPLAVRLGVGGIQALQSILASTTMSDDSKKAALTLLFGIPEADAAKMVIPVQTETQNSNSNGSSSQENSGTQNQGSAN